MEKLDKVHELWPSLYGYGIMMMMTITDYFEQLKTGDIICWGSGKHFRYCTLPFLCKSGLIGNLKGFVDPSPSGAATIEVGDVSYPKIRREDLAEFDGCQTTAMISLTEE